MFLKLTFNVFGDNFDAKKSIPLLNLDGFEVVYEEDFNNHISFINSKSIVEYWDEEYERSYYDFIARNIETLVFLGANDFDIFFDIYKYNLEQCNFEILNPDFFYYINKYKIRLPISVYTIEDDPISNSV